MVGRGWRALTYTTICHVHTQRGLTSAPAQGAPGDGPPPLPALVLSSIVHLKKWSSMVYSPDMPRIIIIAHHSPGLPHFQLPCSLHLHKFLEIVHVHRMALAYTSFWELCMYAGRLSPIEAFRNCACTSDGSRLHNFRDFVASPMADAQIGTHALAAVDRVAQDFQLDKQ